MRIIEHDRILELYVTARSANLFDSREALLSGVADGVRAHLRRASSPAAQILCDLDALNRTDVTADGNLPLAIWLKNAVVITDALVECDVFRRALETCVAARREQATSSTALGADAAHPRRPIGDALTFVVQPGDDVGFSYVLSAGNVFVASVRSDRPVTAMVAPEPSYRRWLADEVVEAAVGEGDARDAELWFVVPQGGEHVLWVENLDERHAATVSADVSIWMGAADPEIE